ncbi:MAG: nucleotide exchange factor GrpE [Rickettsiales bacterium]|jgi:molecular chaperone GrpE|nr:nucleotide exchange factor GrpE [Rickettsiales bacterium]
MNKKNEELEKQADEIGRLSETVEDWKDKYLRLLAEAENTKRRLELDAKSQIDSNTIQFARALLPVADSLYLAVNSMRGKVDDDVFSGLMAVLAQLEEAMRRNGIVKVDTVGQALNPSTMKAISQVERADAGEGSVVEELQSGYVLDGKVLREALVAVAIKPKNVQ